MISKTEPLYSKSRVKLAGKNIRAGNFNSEDEEVFENWRASHIYVLNTFQANLRGRVKLVTDIQIAQRLKRKPTIFDKLNRYPSMQLDTMHDIAGCRCIFHDTGDLYHFREDMHRARFKHKLKHNLEKYNYIDNPKDSGYRGIHDIYEYNVNSHNGIKWNGLHVEIQYRTLVQHMWATAVEVADLLKLGRIKYSIGDDNTKYFFKYASEILARVYEGLNSCLPDISNAQLKKDFINFENELKILRTFTQLDRNESIINFKQNDFIIIIFPYDGESTITHSFDIREKAIDAYSNFEEQYKNIGDVVLVRGLDEKTIRSVYKNYFLDVSDFVNFIEVGLEKLK